MQFIGWENKQTNGKNNCNISHKNISKQTHWLTILTLITFFLSFFSLAGNSVSSVQLLLLLWEKVSLVVWSQPGAAEYRLARSSVTRNFHGPLPFVLDARSVRANVTRQRPEASDTRSRRHTSFNISPTDGMMLLYRCATFVLFLCLATKGETKPI